MPSFRIVALTPAGLLDPSIAIAASRAGELGVLNLEDASDSGRTVAAIGRLARFSAGDCGIRLGRDAQSAFEAIVSGLPGGVKTVILASGAEELARHVRVLADRDIDVLVEVTSIDEAQKAAGAGAHGLVAKGHEAGGWVGEETAFVLLQHLLRDQSLPVWAHGGIGVHTAAAAYAAGAAGIVLDSQLALTKESTLPEPVKEAIGRMDGSETVCLGAELGAAFRAYARPGQAAVEWLRAALDNLAAPAGEARAEWRRMVQARLGWGSPDGQVWPLGQDAAFAAPLARQFHTVGGVLAGLRQAIDEHVKAARTHRPLDADGPLAQAHRTRYPVVQGPMTRVSDRAEFALAVAEAGGLPFLALALMRGPEVESLLKDTQRLLGDRPWGVGILGFVPLELRQEQLEIVRAYRPPFALIAGGRPDQARVLEKDGIPTYLHVPSPGLLRLFLQDGARRFVFEGRECGGHVGPRSSFVLWNLMIDVLLEALPAGELSSCHVLFAGGVHDALSASMVAAMAAPLAEHGAKVGVLLGTAYLFTDEAVASTAIVKGFQEEAVRCRRTVLLETGPGHSTRCADTAFADAFLREKQRLLREGRSPEEIRNELEMLNIGRLRVASKGVQRHPRFGEDPAAPRLASVEDEAQRREGMYMIGQVAALRDRTCTIEQLHRGVAVEGTQRLAALTAVGAVAKVARPAASPSRVAIVGISCMLPKARDRQAYWENILNKVSGITEIPKSRWDWELYFDADPRARDKIYSKWGGFLDDEPFDPVEYGMPPNSLASIDPMQLLALKAARAALRDAGYLDRSFDRSRTSVVLGASGGTGDLGSAYVLRSSLPLLFGDRASDVLAGSGGLLPEWTEDSFAGLLLNVAAGRIANRFDFGGLNYVVDAACASSLTAVHLAVKELETHNTDMVLVGGVDTTQNPFGYLCFSKTHALSPTGAPRTFDASADGIAISEGIVMLVLKRLADAEHDGDRVYAVIQGIGGSSDGRAKGLTAPRPEGQMLALKRAYAKAGISPTTVGLFEAHGTGTVVGDRTEALALSTMLEEAGAPPASAAVGSVKSMIGHTKATAGVAGLAKVALSLYHKVLPPTLGVTEPNPKARFGEGPLFVNSEARPWVHGIGDHPRRAGVNAFGFGGTNFHAILEEYTGDFLPREAVVQRRPSELLLWAGSSRAEIAASLTALEQALERGARPELADLAYTLWQSLAERAGGGETCRLAIVAGSLSELPGKLAEARKALSGTGAVRLDPRGIFFSDRPLAREGTVAFLFPGQGSQYPNMLRDLAIEFAEVRGVFERADRVLEGRLARPLSGYVYPRPAFTPDDERAQQQALTETNVAQPALGAADMALSALLRGLGVAPDLVAGHSYGEYVALAEAAVLSEETLAVVSEARGRSILEAATQDLGTMAAVEAGADAVGRVLAGVADVWIANHNSPEQTIVSGSRAGIEQVLLRFKEQGLGARPVAVACAFHSPLVAPARERLAKVLGEVEFSAPRVPVFSNTTAAPYPAAPSEIAAQLAEHLVRPVRFADEIGAMYEAGARVFVEVGPRNVLVSLVRQVLGDRPHAAIAVDAPGRPGLTQLHIALGQLAVQGVPVRLDRLFDGRAVRRLDLGALEEQTREKPLSATTWMVNGGGVRPAHAPQAARPTPHLLAPLAAAVHGSGNGNANGNGNGNGPAVLSNPAVLATYEAVAAKGNGTSLSTITPPVVSPPAVNAAPLATAPEARAAGADAVMAQFQDLMERFLDTQHKVMLAYLQGAGAEAAATPTLAVSQQVAPAITPLPVSIPAPPVVTPEPAAVVPTPAAAAEVSAPAPVERMTREQLTGELLRIVGERTGYPPEMLDLDVDIEADLGIDSIKRVEILGNVRRACIPNDVHVGEKAMEQLTTIKTMRGIADWLEKSLAGGSVETKDAVAPAPVELPAAAPAATSGAPQAAQPTGEDELVVIPRSMLAVVDAPPLNAQAGRFAPDRVLLVTDDGRGIAQTVGDEVQALGGRVALVRHSGSLGPSGQVEDGIYLADLTDPGNVARLVEQVRLDHGPLGGIVHLLPLAVREDFDAMDLAGWRAALARDVKSLFHLARAAAPDLKLAGTGPGACILAATTMGGAYDDAPARRRPFFPGQGGIAGLVKSLALEWPGVHCKVVGLDAESAAALQAEQLLTELTAGDGLVEVGYHGGQRRILQPRPSPLDAGSPARVTIDADSVVLVTGGARGITAEVAAELAERYRPTLVLVGRSPRPELEESPATRELASPHGLKAALLEGMRQTGAPVTVAQVEAAYQRLVKDREIRANLARMERAGSRVRYVQADARDERAMRSLVETIYREHGRLDGVIHGAGVIEDKLLEDKTPESFDRVFDTKTESAFVLSRILRADSLRFLALFGSAAGPFGNRGQADYSAANEVLNKLALHLGRTWPGRVVSLSWGPWQKTGMVTPELQREFAKRGIELISIPTGCRLFDQELRHGQRGESEVILAGGAWSVPRAETAATSAPARALPLLHGATFANGGGHVVEAVRTLDPAYDLYLADHSMDGSPVLPLAVATELMAELVQKSWPDLQVVGVRELQLLKGVVLENGPRPVRVIARAQVEPPPDRQGIDVNVEIRDVNASGPIHYRATVEMAPELPEPPRFVAPDGAGLQPFPLSVGEAYRQWLFHGPRLQAITEIEGISERGSRAVLDASAPPPALRGHSHPRWLIDPVILDSGLQLFLLWTRAQFDKTTLPLRFLRYRRFGSLSETKLRCHVQVLDRSRDPLFYLDIAFVGPDGRLRGLLEEIEGACSRSLNRLATAPSGRKPSPAPVGESPAL